MAFLLQYNATFRSLLYLLIETNQSLFMIMKPYLIVFLIALVLYSCEVNFEQDSRIIVEGTVVNEVEEPVGGAQISVYTRRANGGFITAPGPSGSSDYLLGRNFSSENGTFQVVSLLDRDEDFSIIAARENYSTYEYARSTVDYLPEDLTFDLETIVLKEVGTINYNIQRDSGLDQSIAFSFVYIEPYCLAYYNEEGLVLESSYCFEERSFSRTLNNNLPNLEGNFKTPLGTIVEFTYTINDNEQITETFILDQENYEFTFSY